MLPDNDILMSCCRSGVVKLWSSETCNQLDEVKAHSSSVNCLATNSSNLFTASRWASVCSFFFVSVSTSDFFSLPLSTISSNHYFQTFLSKHSFQTFLPNIPYNISSDYFFRPLRYLFCFYLCLLFIFCGWYKFFLMIFFGVVSLFYCGLIALMFWFIINNCLSTICKSHSWCQNRI